MGLQLYPYESQILSYFIETKDVIRLRSRKRARISPKVRNLLTILSLIVFPPLGIVLVWRRPWSNAVKYSLTVIPVMVLMLAALLLPSGGQNTNGGVELVGVEREVEVYGPALPTAMVTGYTSSLTTDPVFAQTEETETEYVYAAKGAECYHTYECKFAYASSQKLTVYEAHFLGYKPCNRCKPPVYSPDH